MEVAAPAPLTVVVAALGFLGSFVAGLLGVGGAIVMIPLLLYVPPLLGAGQLGVKAVAGVTMVQVFVAAVSGMLAHRRHKTVNSDVAWAGGVAMASGTFSGALLSKYANEWWLLFVFALMVTAAGVLMVAPAELIAARTPEEPATYSRRLTALVAGGVGVAAGLVGAGGAFLLGPMLIVVVGVPIRVTIGSSLAIVAIAGASGVVGKLATGQVPYALAAAASVAAVPGAQLGAIASRRLGAGQLKLALAAIIVLIGVRVWSDVLR